MWRTTMLLTALMVALTTARAEAQIGGRAWISPGGGGVEVVVPRTPGTCVSIAEPAFNQAIGWGLDDQGHMVLSIVLAARTGDGVMGTVNQFRGGPRGGYGTGWAIGGSPAMAVDVGGRFGPGPGPGVITTRAFGGGPGKTSARVSMLPPDAGG